MNAGLPRRSALAVLIQKELREIARDGRFWVIGCSVFGLLLLTLGLSFREMQSVRAERNAAQAVANEHFRTQDEKNPHAAAHYGTYVFKPSGVLSFVNPGVDAFVGASLKLEAHKRNALEGARARDGTALSRFARLSVASVIELLVPLLIISIGFAAWSGERERGTLRQIASLGIQPRALFLGKFLGLAAALGLVLLPALVVGALSINLLSSGEAALRASQARLCALGLGYLVYLGIWALLTLLVSARAGSSQSSLVVLVALWIGTSLVVPRLAADAAVTLGSAPSQAELASAVRSSLEKGLAGGPAREERVSALTEALLEKQGFQGAETLMDASLLNGIELQAEAEFENEVLDHHFSALSRALERQEQWEQALGFLTPVVAVRSLSMAFSGTDAAHHRHFSDRAEEHRRNLVELLNREVAEKGGADAFAYKAGRELWERAPPFVYQPPTLRWILERQDVSLLVLGGWLLIAGAGAWLAVSRMRVV